MKEENSHRARLDNPTHLISNEKVNNEKVNRLTINVTMNKWSFKQFAGACVFRLGVRTVLANVGLM